MYIHTIQLVGMSLIVVGLCIYAFYVKNRLATLDEKLEKLEESFEKHTHCSSCGALNSRCACK